MNFINQTLNMHSRNISKRITHNGEIRQGIIYEEIYKYDAST